MAKIAKAAKVQKAAKTTPSSQKPAAASLERAEITESWRALAEERCDSLGERLTTARLGAYAELVAAEKSLTAYELIALLELRQDRKIAPLTVYRHLDFLTRVGLVHRIESTQSYVVCAHPAHQHHSQHLICSACGSVEEFHSAPMEDVLDEVG